MFKAIYLTQDEEKNVSAEIADLNESDLPEHDVAIDVEYSTINYKDGLAIMGKPIPTHSIKSEDPDQETIERIQTLLLDEMQEIFDRYKGLYGWDEKQLIIK